MSGIDFSQIFKLLSYSNLTSNQQSSFGNQISKESGNVIYDRVSTNIVSNYQNKGNFI
jgi:hypothetical protein